MKLRRISAGVTIGLGCLAVLLWFQGWWNGARPGGTAFGGSYSTVYYPLWCGAFVAACACVGWILITAADALAIGEPRCRKCRYILRGLSEPRCPECGEPI